MFDESKMMEISKLLDEIFQKLPHQDPKTRRLLDVLHEYSVLFDKKQHDYGPRNISDFGVYGVMVRMNDKMQRLINLKKNGNEASNESIRDSWLDMLGYSAIGLMLIDEVWDMEVDK